MKTARDGADALLAALRAQGGTSGELAERTPVTREGLETPGPAQIAASGPRAAGSRAEYELLLEMILEGSRLHYGTPLVLRPTDPDLALLLGDQLYALGLARLAALGDVQAVAELADVISLIAQAHAGSDADLAAAVWEAGAVAVGWGSSEQHEWAKELARAGDARAAAVLRGAAEAEKLGAS